MSEKRTPVGVPTAVIYASAAMLAAALLPWPYGYYQLLRLVACGVFAYAAYVAFRRERAGYGFGYAILAALFNPFVPVYLSREVWAPIDVGAALWLLVSKKVIGPVLDKNGMGN
jgi:hypothetical protein